MNHCIRKYSPMIDERGCSSRKVPPQATVRLINRTHLSCCGHPKYIVLYSKMAKGRFQNSFPTSKDTYKDLPPKKDLDSIYLKAHAWEESVTSSDSLSGCSIFGNPPPGAGYSDMK